MHGGLSNALYLDIVGYHLFTLTLDIHNLKLQTLINTKTLLGQEWNNTGIPEIQYDTIFPYHYVVQFQSRCCPGWNFFSVFPPKK